MGKSQELYKKAKTMIPGGTQLLSHRPEMFLPDLWPSYYKKAKGCHVWDLDDNEYIDMSYMAVGACVLGYSDSDVVREVEDVIHNGNMCTLNAPEEVALTELLCEIHPWAEMARFAKCGGEALAVAVRIARASTGKDIVLFSGYHGWHDWYLSANLADDKALDGHLIPGLNPAGVPRSLKETSLPFVYNDTNAFLSLCGKYKGRIAAVIIESIRNDAPHKEFIDAIQNETQKEHIVFIVDEVSAGWRLNVGGAHLLYDMKPDMAVFAKAISNGFPMGAVIGKKSVMDAAQTSFISSTYWTDRIGSRAAIASINKMKKENVPQHLDKLGKMVQDGWRKLGSKHNLPIEIGGIRPLSHFIFKTESPLIYKTLFTQEMLDKGFLATNAFYASFAHKVEHVEKYLAAADKVFSFIARAMDSKTPEKFLKSSVCHSGFKRLN